MDQFNAVCSFDVLGEKMCFHFFHFSLSSRDDRLAPSCWPVSEESSVVVHLSIKIVCGQDLSLDLSIRTRKCSLKQVMRIVDLVGKPVLFTTGQHDGAKCPSRPMLSLKFERFAFRGCRCSFNF